MKKLIGVGVFFLSLNVFAECPVNGNNSSGYGGVQNIPDFNPSGNYKFVNAKVSGFGRTIHANTVTLRIDIVDSKLYPNGAESTKKAKCISTFLRVRPNSASFAEQMTVLDGYEKYLSQAIAFNYNIEFDIEGDILSSIMVNNQKIP